MISHSFESLTIKQITMLLCRVFYVDKMMLSLSQDRIMPLAHHHSNRDPTSIQIQTLP